MIPPDLPALMARGYLLTVIVEGLVLLVGLKQLSLRQRLFAAFWLTAVTYPYVWLVYPLIFDNASQRTAYLLAAETFAPAAECLAYRFAFAPGESFKSGRTWIAFAVIIVANLSSFVLGAIVPWYR